MVFFRGYFPPASNRNQVIRMDEARRILSAANKILEEEKEKVMNVLRRIADDNYLTRKEIGELLKAIKYFEDKRFEWAQRLQMYGGNFKDSLIKLPLLVYQIRSLYVSTPYGLEEKRRKGKK
ncbi:MAG: hypothetical protein ACK413_03225 [Patescibacteria group bacterium]